MGGAQNRHAEVQSKISKTKKTLGRGTRENAGIINQEIVARVVHFKSKMGQRQKMWSNKRCQYKISRVLASGSSTTVKDQNILTEMKCTDWGINTLRDKTISAGHGQWGGSTQSTGREDTWGKSNNNKGRRNTWTGSHRQPYTLRTAPIRE